MALLACSCEKDLPEAPLLEGRIASDFEWRFPNSNIIEASRYDLDNSTKVKFTDEDGLCCVAFYLGDDWAVSERTYDNERFLSQIPRQVARTYIKTGIDNERYDGDNFYVIEIARSGIDKKQYEFHCVAPYSDGSHSFDNLDYDIVIDEDGTLLSLVHYPYNRSIWRTDISSSIKVVRDKYSDATILGAVNDMGSNAFFIRDNGIVKTVTTRDYGEWVEWIETRHSLDIDTVLPASVLAAKEEFEAKHPELEYSALAFVENRDGRYYRLTFGIEIENISIYSEVSQ